MSRDELARIVDVWQARLRLDHWGIRIDEAAIDRLATVLVDLGGLA